MEGEHQIPFSVSPKEGSLEPNQEMECCIKFSPSLLFEYKSTLICRVLNCQPDMEKKCVVIHGSTLMPVCHFQIEESDYLSSGRRIPSLPAPCRIGNDISFVPGAPLNSDTKVIEFKSFGSGHPCVRYER
ncbi:hydrocephalus-inducing protein-like [Schistocerca americana]|uniref:hydrocephalus-inducing protein-like n=1 Tax=Schistocerca americana TaxID=7009 RepID=UPI001F4F4545|nr:hydrocephalus-inducing protein-like [Schistocerca americana]